MLHNNDITLVLYVYCDNQLRTLDIIRLTVAYFSDLSNGTIPDHYGLPLCWNSQGLPQVLGTPY